MFVLREAFIGLKRNGTITAIAIGVIFFSLLILGIFLVFTFNLFGGIKYVESKVDIAAFLKDNVPVDTLKVLEEKIKKIVGVKSIQYITKEQALKELKEELSNAQEILNAIETNPLPTSFRIKLEDGYHNLQQIESIAKKISVFKEIEDITYGKLYLQRLDFIVKVLFLFDIIMGIIISTASIFVVSNTIRLTVISRKDSIEIMNLVGATDNMIRAPFIIEGIIEGFLGALLAVTIIYVFYYISAIYITYYFPRNYLLVGIILFGIILGYIGSRNAVKAYISGGEM